MEKNRIFRQRKEIKKSSHKVVRGHYFVLVFLCLFVMLFGTEYGNVLSGWSESAESEQTEQQSIESVPADGTADVQTDGAADAQTDGTADVQTDGAADAQTDGTVDAPADGAADVPAVSGGGNLFELFRNGIFANPGSVLTEIMEGRLTEGEKRSGELEEQIRREGDLSKALGRTNGILAQLVNGISAGKPFVMAGMAIFSIVHSEEVVAAIFFLLSLLWHVLLFVFFKNVLRAVYRRIFLEAQVYEKIVPADLLHFFHIRKWTNASMTMLLQYIYSALWNLTIIGGIIKAYSYAAVPYIVAENPQISPRSAIRMSRMMMNGHKWELFLFDLSQLGWILLGAVTFGISEILYGVPYREACRARFYAMIREEAIAKQMDGYELLDDTYLFKKADRIKLYETYFEVVDEITQLHEERVELKGFRKFAAEWLGVWLDTREHKKRYDEVEGRKHAIRNYKLCMVGEAYPSWLNPRWRKAGLQKGSSFNFLRSYTVWSLFLLFITFAFIGWSWEVALHFMQTGEFSNRGTLLGPWLPIYGTGGVVVLMLCSKFRKNPALEFVTAVILCGILEYVSGWYLEMKFHQRWWSYDGYFLNLHGRICAEGLLVFGIGCCAVVYLAAPFFDHQISKLRGQILIPLCVTLMILYGADLIHSSSHPNMAKGAIEESDAGWSQGAAPDAYPCVNRSADGAVRGRENQSYDDSSNP